MLQKLFKEYAENIIKIRRVRIRSQTICDFYPKSGKIKNIIGNINEPIEFYLYFYVIFGCLNSTSKI